MFKRIAIVNRGEAAMRLINAVRELNAEHGSRIETVALYTDAERTATFVRAADLAYPLGPAADRPYLDQAKLERALHRERGPTRPGSAGGSSPRTRRSRSSASGSG